MIDLRILKNPCIPGIKPTWFGSADSLTDKSAEIPVGCIIVDSEGNVVARSHNTRRHTHSVTGHAEINAIEEFTSKTGNYRLCGATIFVTLEPCPMCAGALAAAKPDAVYYGAPNTENGSCGTVFNILNSHTKIYGGIKSNEIILINNFPIRKQVECPNQKTKTG